MGADGVSPPTRAAAMDASIRRAMRAGSVGEPEIVSRAVALAMEPRIAGLRDDHHPAYLHPGRSVLILLRDVGAVSASGLATAAILESEDEALRIDEGRVAAQLGDEVAGWAARAPGAGDEALVERLLDLPHDAALASLAERLDHLRHLHLRNDLEPTWRARHEEVVRAWQPFAARVDERLERRFAHWSRTFARRLERQSRSG